MKHYDPRWLDEHFMEVIETRGNAESSICQEDIDKAKKICDYYESYGLDCNYDEEARKLARIREYYDSWDEL